MGILNGSEHSAIFKGAIKLCLDQNSSNYVIFREKGLTLRERKMNNLKTKNNKVLS